MFGWMETWAALHLPPNPQPPVEAIIPTIVLPFALAGAILSSLVTAIAAWFGITLKATGPKRLLELLLTPKVLVSALVFNAVVFGGYSGYKWMVTKSRPLWWIEFRQARLALPSESDYPDNWNRDAVDSSSGASDVERSRAVSTKLSVDWENKLPSGAFRGFSLSGASAFAGTMDGFVVEIDQDSGKVLRRFYIGHPSVPRPVVYKGNLLAGEGEHLTHHARIYSFDLKTGELARTFETKGHTEGDLVISETSAGPVLFVAAGADGIYALDPETLELKWHAALPHFDSGVTVDRDQVFFATGVEKGSEQTTPRLYALEVATGKINWQVDLGASGWSRPIVQGDRVCVALGEIYSKRRYGQLACFDALNGNSRSAMNFEAPLFNTPEVIGNDVLISMVDGTICRVNPSAQSRAWCRKVESKGAFYPWPVTLGEGAIVVPQWLGFLVLDANSGESLAEWKAENENSWVMPYAGVSPLKQGWLSVDAKGLMRRINWHYLSGESRNDL